MHNVSVLGKHAITIGKDLATHIAETTANTPASAYVFVSDSNVAPLHLQPLISAFTTAFNSLALAPKILQFVVPAGEVHKTRQTKAAIEDFMLKNACTRHTVVVALGGGVIGDLVGFVAATFMRGVPVLQIPTTLLAMVDSSVGGKTAIDTPNGKNLVGAFHQPLHTYIDITYLRTLPKREFVNGLAEVIKTAAIWNAQEFTMLENHSSQILALVGGSTDAASEDVLVKLILGSVGVKAHVVTIDEKETGLRGLLNYGHTIGHAIEAMVFPDLLHGECISIGMVLEAEVSRYLGHLNNVGVGRVVRCLKAYGLPTMLGDTVYAGRTSKVCGVDQLIEIMKVDKKNQGDKKRIVLLKTIGETVEPRASFVEDDVIRKILCNGMRVVSKPLEEERAKTVEIQVPGSKSISNRALVMAALGTGVCRLKGLLHSDDVQVMLDSLAKLVGIKFNWEDNGDILVIEGGGGRLSVPDSELYLGNAGTASRFLTSVVALIRGDSKADTVLTGNARMKQRPIGPLVTALRENGAQIAYLESEGCFPIRITALETGLPGGTIKLSASVSSQYVSSILIAAPYAREPVILDLSGDSVISQPYIDMTIAMMRGFGVVVERLGDGRYKIPVGGFKNPSDYLVEADASSATYPLAYAAITGAQVTVTNIGSESLQGDAAFAVKVLKEMGCFVTQTGTTTTVRGCDVLRPLKSIDMESMTDAFMTAVVLAAVAPGVTRIHGIANQRVKECDRIAAMRIQLSRIGVTCVELEDGIEVHGVERERLGVCDNIGCYDDHRIAMSFSVLGACYDGRPGLVIGEKRCVEKTWPAWWDALSNTLGVETQGVDLVHDVTEVVDLRDTSKSIVLVGMRGAGKTSMGRAGARILGRAFIDLDTYLENKAGVSIPLFIEKNGWEAFRALETLCLKDVLVEQPTGAVIACGGGVVEAPENCDRLRGWDGLVVHIKRDINDVEAYLDVDTTRPMYGQDMRSTWKRREPLYLSTSNSEFLVLSPSKDADPVEHYKQVEKQFGRFLDFHLGRIDVIPNSELSFFVSLTSPRVTDVDIEKVSEGADALELRVDLLENTEREFVATQLGLLRSISSLPVVFTVRTKSQGGQFPDDKLDDMVALLQCALRWGCEYVDVEFSEPMSRFSGILAAKGYSKIIGSYHDIAGVGRWGVDESMCAKYRELHAVSDIIKIIGRASTIQDNFSLYRFVHEIVPALGLENKPLITLLMGAAGQLSRSLNTFLTPVTHAALNVSAAPGQVTISEIHTMRHLMGLIGKQTYCLFGTPIQQSMSPTLHNTGFAALGLPFTYGLCETGDWKQVKETMKTTDGASVTIPLKVDILKNGVCDIVDPAAAKIGAINTLVKVDGKITGYNTDWIGMKRLVEKSLDLSKPAVGVVLGAGGTSRAALYALKSILQVKEIRVWNRTHAKAVALADEFGATAISDVKDLLSTDDVTSFVVIGTIPSDAQHALDLGKMFEAARGATGVVVDMAYRPRETLLLKASKNFGSWTRYEGIQVLLEQGYEQFRLWTGRPAPQKRIEAEVMAKY